MNKLSYALTQNAIGRKSLVPLNINNQSSKAFIKVDKL